MAEMNSWPGWKIVRMLGSGSFGDVYEICKEENPNFRAALKVISIPRNRAELESVYNESMDEQSVTTYFRSMVDDVTAEFALMEKLKGFTNIVSYLDHMIVEHKDSIGWDILIRMELLTPLPKYEAEHPLTEKDIISLGKDISKALEICQRDNIIHRDIKPENIFVNEFGDFELGDFGIARHMEKSRGTMSTKGTYTYMAPEVYKGEHYSANVDVYSLGIMLYRYLNEKRAPFLPIPPNPISYKDRESALERRMGGEQIPEPIHGSKELKRIVMKAISYDPNLRYQSAAEFRKDLEKNVDSYVEEDPNRTISFFEKDQGHSRKPKKKEKVEDIPKERPGQEDRNRRMDRDNRKAEMPKSLMLPIVLLVAAVITIAAVIIAVKSISNNNTSNKDSQTVSDTQVNNNTQVANEVQTESKKDIKEDTKKEETIEKNNFPSNVAEYKGHHYAVYDYTDLGLAKEFDSWEKFCESQGGYLAVINNKKENDFLYNYLKSNDLPLAFFGYTDQGHEGKWTWVNGKKSKYKNWAHGQPNNGAKNGKGSDEDYAQFYKESANGTWNDSKIAVNTYKFICEWDY